MAAQKSGDSEKRFEKEKFVQIDHGEKTHPPSQPEPEHHLASGHPAQMNRSPVAQGTGGEGYDKECKPEAENQKAGGWGVQLWGPKAPGPKDHQGGLVGPLWASSIPKSAELIRGMKRLLAGVRGDRGHRG